MADNLPKTAEESISEDLRGFWIVVEKINYSNLSGFKFPFFVKQSLSDHLNKFAFVSWFFNFF